LYGNASSAVTSENRELFQLLEGVGIELIALDGLADTEAKRYRRVSNEAGNFSFERIPTGRYRLQVRASQQLKNLASEYSISPEVINLDLSAGMNPSIEIVISPITRVFQLEEGGAISNE